MIIDHAVFDITKISPAPKPVYQKLYNPHLVTKEMILGRLSKRLRKLNPRQLKKRFQNHVK